MLLTELGLVSCGNPAERPLIEAAVGHVKPERACSKCGASGVPLKSCSNCHLAWYCGRECQVAHWKREHKKVCKKPAATAPLSAPAGIDVTRGILSTTPEATPLPRGMVTQPLQAHSGTNGFEWDINTWQHSKPAVFNMGRGAGCMQCETSICTIQPLPLDGTPCTIRILEIGEEVGIGLCTRRHGKMDVYWKFASDSSCQPSFKLCSSAVCPVAYGRRFGSGDSVTLCVINEALEFSINGMGLGPAFTGFKSSLGPFYVRVHMLNDLKLNKSLALAHQAMHVEQLIHMQNMGLPDPSDPGSGRAEVEITVQC